MSNREIRIRPLTAESFAPFGDLMEAHGKPTKIINQWPVRAAS